MKERFTEGTQWLGWIMGLSSKFDHVSADFEQQIDRKHRIALWLGPLAGIALAVATFLYAGNLRLGWLYFVCSMLVVSFLGSIKKGWPSLSFLVLLLFLVTTEQLWLS